MTSYNWKASVRQKTLSIGKNSSLQIAKGYSPTYDRGLKYKIYKELKKLVTSNPNNPIKKWGTELKREFSTEESQMVEKHLKKYSR